MQIIKNRDYNFIQQILEMTKFENLVKIINIFANEDKSFYFEPTKKYTILRKQSENQVGFSNKYVKFKHYIDCLKKVKYSHSTADFYCFKDNEQNVIRVKKINLLYVIFR